MIRKEKKMIKIKKSKRWNSNNQKDKHKDNKHRKEVYYLFNNSSSPLKIRYS